MLKQIRGRFRSRKAFGISNATGEGLPALLDHLIRELDRIPRKTEGPERPPRVREERVRAGFEVSRAGGSGVFLVTGKSVERMAAMTNMGQPESVERFQKTMKRIGLDKSLKRLGICEGDTVRIGPVQLEWGPDSDDGHSRASNRRRPPYKGGY